VASFIGSPAMNLIKGEIVNKKFNSDLTSVNGFNARNGKITLGFRAEDASVVKNGGQINAPIYTIEILGDATMVTVKIGKSLVSIKADKNFRANIEDKVSIKIPAQKCHLFDQKTGDRLGG
jgi:multiple sugar transport system ATP-binding protein